MPHPFSAWTVTGERNRDIQFDINSTPLQIHTNAEIGSGDVMWVQFLESNMINGAGISIYFKSEPVYNFAFCEAMKIPQNKLGTDDDRIWTIEKDNTRVKLTCNGEKIFDIDTQLSTVQDCKTRWEFNFEILRFPEQINQADTASHFFRQYNTGTTQTFHLLWIVYTYDDRIMRSDILRVCLFTYRLFDIVHANFLNYLIK